MTGESLDRVAALAEPVRRALYQFVSAQPGPVDRDAAAAGTGIGRPLAAFHLDRLVAAGLLEVEYHRRSGRTGPGAGRPAKFYRRPRGSDVHVSLPPRQYDMAADILASAVEQTANAPESVIDAARERGRAIAVQRTDAPDPRGRLVELLAGNGYEPMAEPDGSILLPNCPFDALVREHRNLTCSMNLALLSSVTQVLDQAGLHAVAAPHDRFCCVALVPENHRGPSDVSPGEVNAMDAPSGPKER